MQLVEYLLKEVVVPLLLQPLLQPLLVLHHQQKQLPPSCGCGLAKGAARPHTGGNIVVSIQAVRPLVSHFKMGFKMG